MKNFSIGIILLIGLVSCQVEKRNQAEQIIQSFQNKNIQDKREVVFEVQAKFEKGKLIVEGETSEQKLKNEIVTELKSFDFSDRISVLPDSTVGKKSFALVNVPVANLRAEPSHSAELVTQAILGTPIKILNIYDDWYYIQTPDKYISWVDRAGILPMTKTDLEKWRNSNRVICNVVNSVVFETQNFENPVSDVTLGCIVQNVEQGWNWIKIQFPDGRTGFVELKNWTDFNEFKNSIQPEPENIISLAKKLTGRSYLWGGTSANAMDCSGFVKTVYFMNGIIMARDASLQTRHGELIEPNSDYEVLQPGDLLFFGRKGNEQENERVTHVALSLGNTEFIHASGIIQQNSFDSTHSNFSEYRKNSFIRARRIIGATDDGIQQLQTHPWY